MFADQEKQVEWKNEMKAVLAEWNFNSYYRSREGSTTSTLRTARMEVRSLKWKFAMEIQWRIQGGGALGARAPPLTTVYIVS